MYRKRTPQVNLFEASSLVPPEKAKRLQSSWAERFRREALPLIDEDSFAPMYSEDIGRPNTPVQIVLGVLVLKEMSNLTDMEALEQLEFNLLWQHALSLTPGEAHLCQKTLHNFRAGLMQHDLGRATFQEITDRILIALGVSTNRQRLDSTHILSNIAILTRLGLFCETLRLFLTKLSQHHPRLFDRVPSTLVLRYLKEDGTATRYEDARSKGSRRRLGVCARDVYRLHCLFAETAARGLEEYGLIARLLDEQCDVTGVARQPGADDDDADEGGVPVEAKDPKTVSSDSLQSPHDPDVAYSSHKGKGFEVQVSETCDESNAVEIITHVEVTDSSVSDVHATIPTLNDLSRRGIQPEELSADTTYGSGENACQAERQGTELVSPVGGSKEEAPDLSDEKRPLTAADFSIDPAFKQRSVCPAGHETIKEWEYAANPNRWELLFDKTIGEECPLFKRCPAKFNQRLEGYLIPVNLVSRNIELRRREEESGNFAPRYAIRAGIEATNSELKRKHGLGKLRVRRRPRVELSVYLKALACNIKRMVCTLPAKPSLPAPVNA